jgi:hypothetical protein
MPNYLSSRRRLPRFSLERVTTKRITQSTHRTAAAKVVEIVGEGMKLKADGAGGERASREPRQSDPSPALVHPQLAGPAFVIEGDGISGRPRRVGDHEAYARVNFAPMPFDLGGDATRPHPSAGGMGEVRKGRRTSFGGRPTGRVSKRPIRSCSTRLVGAGSHTVMPLLLPYSLAEPLRGLRLRNHTLVSATAWISALAPKGLRLAQ